MAHTIIGGGDLIKLRGNQSIPDLALFVTPLDSVVTGVVTAVPSKFPTVSLTVSWDGSTSATLVGQLVRITDGDTIKAYGTIRKAISGSTLYISETPLGAYGYVTMIEQPILVGDVVTIYTHHPMWGMQSRIDAKTKTFYKFWDVPYSAQNEGDIVIANAGTWQGARLASGSSTYRFTLPREGLNTSFGLDASDPDSLLWALPTGVTLVGGYALSDSVIEVDAIAGSHLVKMTATLGSNTHTAYLWLFVSDGANALSDAYAVTVPSSDSQSRLGREMSIEVTGENLQDVLFPGAGVLLREWPEYEGNALSVGVGIDSFVGYIAEIAFSHDGDIGTARLKLESPMVYAQRIVLPPQSLTEKTEATKWTDCESILSNPCGFAYYLMRWHCPALLEMHDFLGVDYISPRRKYLQYQGRTLGDGLKTIADYITGNIGSASDGTTILSANPLYLTQTARDAFDTLITFQEQDIAAPLEYARRMANAYAETRSGVFVYGGTGEPKAYYVGRRWSQGAGSTELPNFTVTAAQGLTEALARIGHFFAEQNAEIQEFALNLLANYDIVDPAYMQWVAFTLSSDFDPYGLGFSSNRILPSVIEREWTLDASGITKTITLRGQGETFGQPGEELPVENIKTLSQNGFSKGSPVIWRPNSSSGLFGGAQAASLALANNANGQFAILFNYLAANALWADLSSSVDNETVNDFDFDYGSAFFANGRDASQSLGAYAVTTDGATVHIWYFADILRSKTAETIKTLTLSDSTVVSEARIICSKSYPLLVLAGFKDGTGTRFSRSTDGGASFGSLTRVGSAITDSVNNDNAPLGMAVDGQRQLITAPDATPVYGTYYASTASGSFSKLSASEDNPYPMPMIAIEPNSTTAYVAGKVPESAVITFDDPSWAHSGGLGADGTQHWHIYNSFWLNDGHVASGGNPNNCVKWLGNTAAITGPMQLASLFVYFGGTYTITQIDFDYYISGSSSWELYEGSTPQTAAIAGTGAWHHATFTLSHSSNQTVLGLQSTADINGNIVTMDIRLDNIEITTVEGFAFAPTLYKVSSFTGSDVWTDISPATGECPTRPYDLAIDLANPAILNTTTERSNNWYSSINRGTAWTTKLSGTNYRALYTKGNAIFAGGSDIVGLALDGGSPASLNGNLASLWADIDTIKRILAL